MKIKLVTCDDTVADPFAVMHALGASNFDDGVTHKSKVAKLYIDEIAQAIKKDITATLYTRCGMVPNLIGELIDTQIIDNTQVEIYLYSATGVKTCGFDKEGYLTEGWPFGILTEDVYECIEELKQNLLGK